MYHLVAIHSVTDRQTDRTDETDRQQLMTAVNQSSINSRVWGDAECSWNTN